MDDIKLLSVKNLADRWGKDESSIRRYIKEGILTPCKGVPGMMFHPTYIEKLEGVTLDRFSPLEKRKLQKDLEELKKQNDEFKRILSNILSESSKLIGIV